MLFEPCGDLKKDYSAFCESLQFTEREDVFSSIVGAEEVIGARRIAAALRCLPPPPSDAASSAHPSDADVASVTSTKITSPRSSSARPTPMAKVEGNKAGKTNTLRSPRAAAGANKDAAVASASTTPRSNLSHATHREGGGALTLSDEQGGLIHTERATLTMLQLRHPTFCLNQRDITPLCRAIPHCHALVSIALVGCGLSCESYMLLTEAVFKSPRVMSVAVEFNISSTHRAAAASRQRSSSLTCSLPSSSPHHPCHSSPT